MKKGSISLGLGLLAFCILFLMQSAGAQEKTFFDKTPFGEDTVVRQKCSVCHKLDENKRVEVIAETRKTPEEWEVVVSRMRRINGAPITEQDFHTVIKELSQYYILTPQEMSEVTYINTMGVGGLNNQFREIPKGETEQRIFTACVRCHTWGKINSHKKTPLQWEENMNMHLGYYPTVVPQMREMDWPKEAFELVDILAERLPYYTEEWANWMKNRKQQDLSGAWKVAGYQPGMGYYEGTYTFKPNADKGEDEYIIKKKVSYANGISYTSMGEGTLYGEYHLRYKMSPNAFTGRVEGVFDLDADTMGFQGTWWTNVQDNNAHGQERFFLQKGDSRVFASFPGSIKADGQTHELTLVGVNLPADLSKADVSFSNSALKVQGMEVSDSKIVCQVAADKGASIGGSDITVKGVAGKEKVLVYDKIDAIRVLPDLGRARVSSGAAYPPEGVQFVARGVNYGKDGKADTEDDLMLDPVQASWSLAEEKTREGDDDLKYLKTSIDNGLYTPVTTYGPIWSRHQTREGIGLIRAVASYKTEEGKELTDWAYLGVTDPDFIPRIK